MIEERFLTQTHTIPNHPVRACKKQLQCKYVSALGEFLCFITQADKKARTIFGLWSNSIIETDINEKWTFTPNFIHLKEALSFDRNDSESQLLRLSLLFDCFYLAEKANCNLIEKSYIFLSRKANGYCTTELIDNMHGFFTGANKGDDIPVQLREHRNADIRFGQQPMKKVLVVATMSAGKSTLINALVGNRINKTAATMCTSKIRLVHNKQANEGVMLQYTLPRYIYTDNYKIVQHDSIENVGVHFHSTLSNERLCLIDTPGDNFHGDPSHKEITRNAIKANDYDILLFVSNATQFLTNDDAEALEFVIRNCRKKIIFCLNKCDRFKPQDDSIMEMVRDWEQKITILGNRSPVIVATSAFSALLLKEAEKNMDLTDEDNDFLESMKAKFKREYYHLEKYCTNTLLETKTTEELKHTGIPHLESMIKSI